MYAQPDYPAALSSLQGMTSDQLKDILNRYSKSNTDRKDHKVVMTDVYSEDKFDEFIRELPQLKSLYSEKEMLVASNKSLAEYNMSQEPVLRQAKEKLMERYGEAVR